jgi:Glycosyl transferase family 2
MSGESIPSYSVVIPVHNGAGYVRRAIESVLAQTVPGEVIVVDDGSTDGSGAAAQSVDSKVIVHRHSTNKGLSEARNTGIRAAKGDVVALLDSDDWWRADKMAKQLALFSARPEVVSVFTDFNSLDVDGKIVGWQGGIVDQLPTLDLMLENVTNDSFLLHGAITEALIRHTSFMHPSSVAIRRSVFERVGYFDPRYPVCQDLEMWLRLSTAGPVGFCAQQLLTIEVRTNSLGHQSLKMADDETRIYASLSHRFPGISADTRAHIRRFLKHRYATMAWLYCHDQRDLLSARNYYRESLRHGWSIATAASLAKTYAPATLWRLGGHQKPA